MTVKWIELLECLNFETQVRFSMDGRLKFYQLTHKYPITSPILNWNSLTSSKIRHNALCIAGNIYLKYIYGMTNDGQDKELFNKLIHSTADLIIVLIDLEQKTATIRTFNFECSGTFEDDETYQELMENLEKLG